MNNIFDTIRQEVDDFIYNSIEVVSGYNFNQYDTVKRIHLYLNSQFEDKSLYHGREKVFYNISKFRRDAAARFLEIDTKDIRLWPNHPKSRFSTMFLSNELRNWLKENNIDFLMDDIAEELPTYGSVVLRKTKKDAKLIDLRRLFLDPTVENIRDSRFVTIKHYFTASELREKTKDGWDEDAIENIISKVKNQKSESQQSYEDEGTLSRIVSSPYIEVYERYGEVPEHLIKGGKSEKMVRSLTIVAEPYLQSKNESGEVTGDEGEILFKGPWKKDWPFMDHHYSKTKGRWMGVGVIEDLFPAQERFNEMVNQKRLAMEHSAITLYQTADNTVINNLITDLEDADLIKTTNQGSIQRVDNTEKNLGSYQIEFQSYQSLADRVSFANDLVQGQEIKASTPATNAAIQNQHATGHFLFKRKRLSDFYRRFFKDLVLKQVFKDLSDEHILRYTGEAQDIETLDRKTVEVMTDQFVKESVLNNGRVPSAEEIAQFAEQLMLGLKEQGNERFVEMKEKYYDDVDFEFDIMIDGQQEDVAVMAQNTFTVLTAMAQNPMLLDDPVMKELLFAYADKIGIDSAKLELAMGRRQAQQARQPQMQQGGQLSQPDPQQQGVQVGPTRSL